MPRHRVAALRERAIMQAPREEESAAQLAEDAFKQDNLIGGVYDLMGQDRGHLIKHGFFNFRTDYNPYKDDAHITLRRPEFADEYIGSMSPEDTRRIALNVDAEFARRDRLARAGGWGVFASISAGVLSPENVFPVMPAVRVFRAGGILARAGAGGVRGAANVGLSGFLAETIAQEALGAMQVTRTTDEKIQNIVGATLLSGLIGGTFGSLSGLGSAVRGPGGRGLNKVLVNFMGDEVENGVAGSKAPLEEDGIVGVGPVEQRIEIVRQLSQNNPTAAMMMGMGNSALSRIWRKITRWNPQWRLGTSASETARRIIKRLTDNPMLRIRDEELGAEVGTNAEAAIVVAYGRVADGILRIRDVFVGARKRGLGMSQSEFRMHVTKAMRRGDEAVDEIKDAGARDAIKQAAKIGREIFDRIADDAEAVGLLAKRDLKGTAMSYVTRIWDREKVENEIDKLRAILMKHFAHARNPADATERAIDHILGSRTGATFIPADVVGQAGPFRERLLLIQDTEIEEFLENDIVDVLHRFTNEVAPQVELARMFRTGSKALDEMPGRIQKAAAEAERTGNTQELEDLIEDTANLRAAAAHGSTFTEAGLARAQQIERLVASLPTLRTQLREVRKRHRNARIHIDRYHDAKTRKAEIERGVEGTHFDSMPDEVGDAFNAELRGEPPPGAPIGPARSRAFLTPSELKRLNERISRGRRHFFGVWRRWVTGEEETRFPATRAALERHAKKPGGGGMGKVAADYVSAVRRVEAMRPHMGAISASSAALALEETAAQAAVDAANATLKGLRDEAHRIDRGVEVDISPLPTAPDPSAGGGPGSAAGDAYRIRVAISRAEEGVAEARLADAMRAVRLENVAARMRADATAAAKLAKGKRARQIRKENLNEIRDLMTVRDRLLNRAGHERQDPHHWAFRAERFMRRVNFMRFMGGVVISSLVDPAMSLAVNGLGPTLRAYRTVLRSPLREIRNQLKLTPTDTLTDMGLREELVRFSVAIELAMNARVRQFGDVADLVGSSSWAEKGADRLSNTFANMTLINRWNAMGKGIATLASMNRAMDDISRLASGKDTRGKPGQLSVSGARNLAAAGINADMARRIHAQYLANRSDTGGQVLPRTQLWDDLDAKRVFQNAIISDVRRIIVTPSSGDLPRWMSMPLVRLIGQFKSFSMSATTKILMSGIQRHDAAVLQGFIFAGLMGATVFSIQKLIKGEDPTEEELGVWVQNAVDRSGLLGIMMDVNGIAERATHGHFGMSAITGKQVSSRFQSRSVMDAFLGPSLGTAYDVGSLFTGGFSEGGPSMEDARTAVSLVPFNNLFYFRALWNAFNGEEEASEWLGLPERRPAPQEERSL